MAKRSFGEELEDRAERGAKRYVRKKVRRLNGFTLFFCISFCVYNIPQSFSIFNTQYYTNYIKFHCTKRTFRFIVSSTLILTINGGNLFIMLQMQIRKIRETNLSNITELQVTELFTRLRLSLPCFTTFPLLLKDQLHIPSLPKKEMLLKI